MNDLLDTLNTLQAVCENPRGQLNKYLNEGKKVVGCFAPYTPEELIHASGMVPMGLWGGQTELKLAKSYLPAFACPIMQANMELGLKGAYEGLSSVIIPAACDTLRCMTQNWRFGVPSIPMIPIVYPQNRESQASVDYLISEYEHVLVMLSSITGQMMSESSLCKTIEVYNRHNAAMREFAKTALEHLDVITPAVRHIVMKSSFFYEKGEHTNLMHLLTEELKKQPVYHYPGKKVILTGIVGEPNAFLDILSENSITVAGDDLAQEMRQFRTDIPLIGGGGLKRLALQWKARYGCSLIHETGKPRGQLLAALCKETGSVGIINCMMKFCDPEEYDKPFLEKDLSNAGYPCLTLEIDPLNTNFEQLRTRIQTFGEILA